MVLIDAMPDIVSLTQVAFLPGQSVSDTQPWDGIPMAGPYSIGDLTGTFVRRLRTRKMIRRNLRRRFRSAPSTANDLVTSVTTDQTVYNLGQPVDMTFTETNDRDQPVAIVTGSPEFEVTQNGTTVLNPLRRCQPQPRPHGRRFSQGNRIRRQQRGTVFLRRAP